MLAVSDPKLATPPAGPERSSAEGTGRVGTSNPQSRADPRRPASTLGEGEVYVFSRRTRKAAIAGVFLWSALAGTSAAVAREPLRSALLAGAFVPAASLGVVAARHASARLPAPLSQLWHTFAQGLELGTAAGGVYLVSFLADSGALALMGIPLVIGGVWKFLRVYLLAVRSFRGSEEATLELVDFATVAVVFVAVLGYGTGLPLVESGRARYLHVPLLAAFSLVFVVASTYLLLSPLERRKDPEIVFLVAGCLLAAGSLWEANLLARGLPGSGSLLGGPTGALLSAGLATACVAPLFAVRIPQGSEASYRGPWNPPRLLLPYWSSAGLAIMAAAAVVEGSRLAQAYSFGAFGLFIALVVARHLLTLRENYRMFEALRAADEDRRALLAELLKELEEERVRLATALEAGPIEQLSALRLRAERAAGRETSNPQLLLDALVKHLTEVLRHMRDLVRTLRPRLSSVSTLSDAIALQARETLGDSSIRLELALERVDGLTPQQEVHLFRIAEEALDNVRMHAGASKVRVSLKTDLKTDSVSEIDRDRSSLNAPKTGKVLVLEVTDDGKGFVVSQEPTRVRIAGTGIASMRERAELLGARFQIISTPGAGTKVRVAMPLAGSGVHESGSDGD